MNVESRDSVSLKPAELDEFGHVLQSAGLPLRDEELDRQIEQFPLVVLVTLDGDIQGFMFGSLERIGGTPSILWGLGATRRGRDGAAALKLMPGELARRAAISFPDEDVLVATRLAHPAAYTLLTSYANVVPRPGYNPSGEERAWGRRLAKRFGHDGHFDDRSFRIKINGRKPPIVPILDATPLKATGGSKVVQLVGAHDPARRGDDRLRLGGVRGARRRHLHRRRLSARSRHPSSSARNASGSDSGARHENRSQT